MTIQELRDSLYDLNHQITVYEEEIMYLEEYLISTSGAAEGIIEDLENNKDKLHSLQLTYSENFKQLRDLQEDECNKESQSS